MAPQSQGWEVADTQPAAPAAPSQPPAVASDQWQVVDSKPAAPAIPLPKPAPSGNSQWQVAKQEPHVAASTTAPAMAAIGKFLTSPTFDPIEQAIPFGEMIKPLTDYIAAKGGTAGKLYSGVMQGEQEAAKGTTSPLNAGLLVGTGGLEAVAPIMSRLLSAGFSVESLASAWENIPELRKSLASGDYETSSKLIAAETANLAMAGAAATHAAGVGSGPPIEHKPLLPEAFDSAIGKAMGITNIGEINDAITNGRLQPSPSRDDIKESLELNSATSGSKQAEENIHALESGDTGRESINAERVEAALSTPSQGAGEADIRGDRGIAGGEGAAAGGNEPSANEEAAGGAGANGAVDIATIGPIAQLHETLTGRPLDISNEAGERGDGSVMTRPPAISPPVDRELANGGITVMRPGKDLGLIPRYLGSLSQQAARLNNPQFKAIANKIMDVTINLARNGRDAIQDFRSNTRSIITPNEWKNQIVPLLETDNDTAQRVLENMPDNIRHAYENERLRLDQDRLDIIAAKRRALIASGAPTTYKDEDGTVKQIVPDDWGIKNGYYHHAFPGNWTIMQKVGSEYEPIDTGWRQITFDDAHAKAQEYLAAHPEANLKVSLDTATMPGSNYTDKKRLLSLMESVKAASELIYNGHDPDGVVAQLKEETAAAAYGPRRPAQRMNPAVLQRESNLSGYASDIDNYERYIIGIERYKQMVVARQELLATRNRLAESSGMAPIQRISEMPARQSGQYANMLGRADASIEALEGYPTGFDAAVRNRLQQMGYDPNMVDRAYSYINSAEALLKLGFNPASSGLHMAQTLAATYPVLGERYTLHGLLNSYSPKYADLVHDLGIQATSNLMDIDTFNAYKGGYFNKAGIGQTLAGGYKILQDSGLFMFSKGVETARRIAAIGAYQKALDMGMDQKGARNYARDQLIRTQFMYSPSDAPIALRQLPRPLTQFRNFTLKMMEFTTGLRGMEIPRFLLAMGAIGYAGLPALTALSSMLEYTTGYNPEDEMKKFLPRASRGVLGMLGVDYTNNIGFADWFGSRSLDPDKLLGPAGSDIMNLGKAAIAEAKGPSRQGEQDIATALRNISPEARRIYDESARLAKGDNSIVDPRSGSVVMSNLSPGERIEMLAGLTPIRVAEERDTHDRIVKEIDAAKDKRGYFVDSIAAAQLEMMRGDLSMQQHMQIVAQVANLSKMAQDYGVANGLPEAVKMRARQMLSDRLQRDVKGAPKSIRPQVYNEQQQFKQDSQ